MHSRIPALGFACLFTASLSVFADEGTSPLAPASVEGAPPVQANIQRWADRCTDFTTNGWAFKSPERFLAWLDMFSDPGIWLEFARRSLEPQTYVRTADSLLDPATVRNYLEWSDPAIYDRWGTALADPQFITTVNTTLFDPDRFMRWMMLPLDPGPWNIMLTAMNPETWVKWLSAPTDPATQALLAKAADPNTLNAWLHEFESPGNYPDVLKKTPVSRYSGTAPVLIRQ
jgi:hypothetical protein